MNDLPDKPISVNNANFEDVERKSYEFEDFVRTPDEIFNDLQGFANLRFPITLCSPPTGIKPMRNANNELNDRIRERKIKLITQINKLKNILMEVKEPQNNNIEEEELKLRVQELDTLKSKSQAHKLPTQHLHRSVTIESIVCKPQQITCVLKKFFFKHKYDILYNKKTIITIVKTSDKSTRESYIFEGNVTNDIENYAIHTYKFSVEQILEILTELIILLNNKKTQTSSVTTCGNIDYFFKPHKPTKFKGAGSKLRKTRKPRSRKHKKHTHRRNA